MLALILFHLSFTHTLFFPPSLFRFHCLLFSFSLSLHLSLLQWLVTGGPGCPGARAVRRVVRALRHACACATTPRQPSMAHLAPDPTPRHKCARRDPVQVYHTHTHTHTHTTHTRTHTLI